MFVYEHFSGILQNAQHHTVGYEWCVADRNVPNSGTGMLVACCCISRWLMLHTVVAQKLLVAECTSAKKDSNLVDSASSHTLVSKIKPCMSKYKSFTLKLRMAHYISFCLFDSPLLLGYP